MTKEYLETILTEYGVAFTDSLADRLLKEFKSCEDVPGINDGSYNSIKTELKPCDDAISRQAVLDEAFEVDTKEYGRIDVVGVDVIDALLPVNPQPKIGYCRDCKWWKDTDGVFRRGIEAESQCPMNRIEVYEGNGYCYMFEPQESEE